jgi:hypothetical protein
MRETQYQSDIRLDRQDVALALIVGALGLVLSTAALWIGLR